MSILNYADTLNQNNLGDTLDYLNGSVNPTVGQSIGANLKSGFEAPFVAGDRLLQVGGFKSPGNDFLENAYEQASDIAANASGGAAVAGFIANIAGSALNPINLAAGEVAGLAVKGAATGLLGYGSTLMSKLAGTAAEEIPSAVTPIASTLGKYITPSIVAASHSAGAMAGFMLPSSIANNYNEATNTLDTLGIIKDTAENGAIGFGIGAIPFAIGLIGSKLSRGEKLSPEEEAFVGPPSPDNIQTSEAAENIINKNVNHPNVELKNGVTNFKVGSDQDAVNIASTLADSISAKGVADPDVLKVLLSSSARPLFEDQNLMDAVKRSLDVVAKAHDDAQMSITKQLNTDTEGRSTLIKKILNLDESTPNEGLHERITNPNNQYETNALLNYADDYRPTSSRASKTEFKKVTDMIGLLEARSKFYRYNAMLQNVKKILPMQLEDLSDETSSNTILNHLKSATDDTQPGVEERPDDVPQMPTGGNPFLDVEPDEEEKPTQDESINPEKNGTESEEPLPESPSIGSKENLKGAEKKQFYDDYKNAQDAIKSTKATKIFQQVVNCIINNKGE